jgi:hypothetical protein
MATKEVLRQRLAEAEEALHQLQMGEKPRVFQDQNGERVEYTVASIPKLQAYIAKLEYLIDPSSAGNRSIGYTV